MQHTIIIIQNILISIIRIYYVVIIALASYPIIIITINNNTIIIITTITTIISMLKWKLECTKVHLGGTRVFAFCASTLRGQDRHHER